MRFGTPAELSVDNGSPTTFHISGKTSDLVVVTLWRVLLFRWCHSSYERNKEIYQELP